MIWVPSCALLMKPCTLYLGGDIFGFKSAQTPRYVRVTSIKEKFEHQRAYIKMKTCKVGDITSM